MSCPRCVRSIAPDATRCPHCGYDIPPPTSGTFVPVPPDPQPVIAATPWDQTSVISRVPGAPHRSWRGPITATVMGIALLAAVAFVAVSRTHHTAARTTASVAPTTSGAPSSPSPSPSSSSSSQVARTQASTISGYLVQSAVARSGVSSALTSIGRCTGIPAAVTTLQDAAIARTRIVTALGSTDLSALPGSTALVADLRQALLASADADQHYAAWGQAMRACKGRPSHNADYADAQRSDTVATAAKRRFTHAWNPIAVRLGLPKQDADTI